MQSGSTAPAAGRLRRRYGGPGRSRLLRKVLIWYQDATGYVLCLPDASMGVPLLEIWGSGSGMIC